MTTDNSTREHAKAIQEQQRQTAPKETPKEARLRIEIEKSKRKSMTG